MHQTAALLQTLKQALKSHGKTYADVALVLGLSEISVKRLFATQGFSLTRLEQVCQMIDMEMRELFELMNARNRHIRQLTLEQEKQIVGDIKLLLIAVCVLNQYSLEEIRKRYNITEPECISRLVQLDRMDFIELLPKNRIKLLVTPDFAWIPGGPIKKFFENHAQSEFFAADFSPDSDQLICLNAMLSSPARGLLIRKLEELRTEFTQISNNDAALPLHSKQWSTMVLAIRQWEPSLFDELRK